ncbi:MAG TPA: hydrogenase maturation protease [Verrucomicrobiae bacterium]|jgi:hydrogenase maturation protease
MSPPRILIAGVGNIFLGDDAFGAEVARRMAGRTQLPGVRVADFGIRGIDLAYALMDGYDRVIFVDAMRRGEPPGTLSVIEPSTPGSGAMDTHEMTPAKVLACAKSLGANVSNVLIVVCEPESCEPQMGLSETVEAAVEEAIALVESAALRGLEAAHA